MTKKTIGFELEIKTLFNIRYKDSPKLLNPKMEKHDLVRYVDADSTVIVSWDSVIKRPEHTENQQKHSRNT